MLFEVKGWKLKNTIRVDAPKVGTGSATIPLPSTSPAQPAAQSKKGQFNRKGKKAKGAPSDPVAELAARLGFTPELSSAGTRQPVAPAKTAEAVELSSGYIPARDQPRNSAKPAAVAKTKTQKRTASDTNGPSKRQRQSDEATVVPVQSTECSTDGATKKKTKPANLGETRPTTTDSDDDQDSGGSLLRPDSTNQQPLSKLQARMAEKLRGSRFRWINEQLYTSQGAKSFDTFQQQPDIFDEYHEGFRVQVKSWPSNPLDIFIRRVQDMPKDTVVADMGCGEARLAQSVPQKVHSFDLVAANKFITACNIAHTPLTDASVDVVIFCLALMGTDFLDFIREAHRLLKTGGTLLIAEVVSRITDNKAFVQALSDLGLRHISTDASNKMFALFEFKKVVDGGKATQRDTKASAGQGSARRGKKKSAVSGSTKPLLKPCIYKRR
ncbi:25S rRNA (adenine645-N1)-methyltransferase [Tieghemiomyces parasiticus]|uniref:Ribosomal RNA-processing protein 8 n=1 Tax=Tieghemiomyces parasiticus TaxID=78921 RepID=A0A9W8AJ59_9FUNG|nr:25S rRNA (adenine645-N1)-methyltransferase [Tieghemiomyces parasiticus]